MATFFRWRWVVSMATVLFIAVGMIQALATPASVGAMQAATPAPAPATVAPTAALTAPGSPSVTIPTIPAPVAVPLDPKTTALLVLDITNAICSPRPSCVQTLQADAALLKKARDAGVFVVYSDTGGNTTILPQVAPAAGDPQVSGRADKFLGTNLDDLLKGKGIKTVVIVGYVVNGAVLYTSFGANARGYTAVVPVDGTGAEDPFIVTFAQYQLLNQPGFNNPTNQPLVQGRVTLSRSDLIAFVEGAALPKPAATLQPPATAAPATTAPAAATLASTTEQSGQSSVDALLPTGKGRDLLLSNCTSCHTFTCSITGQRTAGQWANLKNGHRENVSSVSDADYDALFAYLESNFNDTKPEPKLPASLQGVSCTPY